MHVSPQTTIGVTMTMLRRELDERRTMLSMLEAITGRGAAPLITAPDAPTATRPSRRHHDGRPSIAAAAEAILRSANRPMHGLREILPLLEAQGYHLAHRASLAGTLTRGRRIVRTAPGTFAVAGGADTLSI